MKKDLYRPKGLLHNAVDNTEVILGVVFGVEGQREIGPRSYAIM